MNIFQLIIRKIDMSRLRLIAFDKEGCQDFLLLDQETLSIAEEDDVDTPEVTFKFFRRGFWRFPVLLMLPKGYVAEEDLRRNK